MKHGFSSLSGVMFNSLNFKLSGLPVSKTMKMHVRTQDAESDANEFNWHPGKKQYGVVHRML